MKILKQKDKEKHRDEYMVYTSVALIESFGKYIVIKHEVATEWASCNDSITFEFHSYDKAVEFYELFVKHYL